MKILYEDAALWVVVKPQNISSESTERQDGLADLLAAENGGYAGVVHRLDFSVGGVMLYAKTKAAAAELCRQVQERSMQKEYLALMHGIPEQQAGEMRDLLFYDRRQGKSFVADRARAGVKEAILTYTVRKTLDQTLYGPISLASVLLQTGRTHQIRVQLASRGHSLLGDGKYGAREKCPIGLFCHRISFVHPITKKPMQFSEMPQGAPWDLILP
ncbi:MAG: RluA family pseudouridine synthase [Clostridia bacterium]|nr:RluA family pseudouridine synthase [Clostridia bacterium]